MTFTDPLFLLLFLLLIPLMFVYRKRRVKGIKIPHFDGLSDTPPSLRLRVFRLLPIVRILAICGLVFITAGPRISEAKSEDTTIGIDIVLAIDTSSSMSSVSFAPGVTRLDATKVVIREFISARINDRIGLVIFQRDALPFTPLTFDKSALDTVVASLNSRLLPDGTGIGLGIATAVSMLRESSAPSRVVILLTDGRHSAPSISPEQASEIAVALNIRIYTIAVSGNDKTNQDVQSVDLELLEEIANRTNGRSFIATNPDDLSKVYRLISSLEAGPILTDYEGLSASVTPWLLVIILLSSADIFLSGGIFRRFWT